MVAPKLRFGDRHFALPRSRIARIVIGVALIIGGILWFLPVLGFWMIPLGLLVLSVDLPIVRRKRRQLDVWWERRRRDKTSSTDEHASEQSRDRPPSAADAG